MSKRRMILRLLLFLVGIRFAIYIVVLATQPKAVSSPQRQSALATLESLTSEIQKQQELVLAVAPEDREAYAAFLAQDKAGIVRLMPGENDTSEQGSKKYVLSVPGEGSYYSFASQAYAYREQADLELLHSELATGFDRNQYGLLAQLGDVDLNSVTRDHPAVQKLLQLAPATLPTAARTAALWAARNQTIDGIGYRDRLPAQLNSTYLLRSIHAQANQDDILVVFRLLRQDSDQSLILLWKEVARFAFQPEATATPQ